jgi:hypothetical protein
MMGEQARSESRCFRLEEQIPEDHLLRRLGRYIDFSFVGFHWHAGWLKALVSTATMK